MIVEVIQGYCAHDFDPRDVFDLFNIRDVSFKDEKQVEEVLQLVMELANNTRIWVKGNTPNKMFAKYEKPQLRSLSYKPFKFGQSVKKEKVGRNDPCPYGSGKKYKKCCLRKDDM